MIIFKELNDEIYRLCPSNISKHCGDISKMNVLDISPTNGGITNHRGMSDALEKDPRVNRVLSPYTKTYDPAIHIEINQNL